MLILFTIIDEKRPRLPGYINIFCILWMLLALIFLPGRKLPEEIAIPIFICPYAIMGVANSLINQVREKGQLSMNASVIQTLINGELKVYKVSELSAIKLEIREFDGDFRTLKSPQKSGLNNFISFMHEGGMLRYELQLLPEHKPWLKELIGLWTRDAVPFELIKC